MKKTILSLLLLIGFYANSATVTISQGEIVEIVVLTMSDSTTHTYMRSGTKIDLSLPSSITLPSAGQFVIFSDSNTPVSPILSYKFVAAHRGQHDTDNIGGGAFDSEGDMWVAIAD